MVLSVGILLEEWLPRLESSETSCFKQVAESLSEHRLRRLEAKGL